MLFCNLKIMGKNAINQEDIGPNNMSRRTLVKGGIQSMVAGIVGLAWLWEAQDQTVAVVTPWSNLPGRNLETTAPSTLEKSAYQEELEKLRKILHSSDIWEINTLITNFWKRLEMLIVEMSTKEDKVEQEQIKIMGEYYTEVMRALTTQQGLCNTAFLWEKDPIKKEALQLQYTELSTDIETLKKLPGVYKKELTMSASQRTVSPGDIINFLAEVTNRYSLQTFTWKPIQVEKTTPVILRQVEDIHTLWSELEGILKVKKERDITFQINEDLVMIVGTLKGFMSTAGNIDNSLSPLETVSSLHAKWKNIPLSFSWIESDKNWWVRSGVSDRSVITPNRDSLSLKIVENTEGYLTLSNYIERLSTKQSQVSISFNYKTEDFIWNPKVHIQYAAFDTKTKTFGKLIKIEWKDGLAFASVNGEWPIKFGIVVTSIAHGENPWMLTIENLKITEKK